MSKDQTSGSWEFDIFLFCLHFKFITLGMLGCHSSMRTVTSYQPVKYQVLETFVQLVDLHTTLALYYHVI